MNDIDQMRDKVLHGGTLTREEAVRLYDAPIKELAQAADTVRARVCGASFDLCTIVNAKSGKCPEDCKYCAQSSCSCAQVPYYPLLDEEEIVRRAQRCWRQGVLRYSIVTSGRTLTDAEVDQICRSVEKIRRLTQLRVCVSPGLLSRAQFARLAEAGVTRVHNNLETSSRYFPSICTTHRIVDKLEAIQAAQDVGLSVCSGGIMGIGETKFDRIDMALMLRSLHVQSVPLNMLNPIPGTALAHFVPLSREEMVRIVAVYRFLMPTASLRLAGGRGLMEDKGEACFRAGANAAISGDMLTTAGITVETDLALIEKLGFRKELCHA